MKGKSAWNPYLAGALSGMVSIGSIYLLVNTLAPQQVCSNNWNDRATVFPDRVAMMPYFMKELPVIDWQWMFVIGIAVGAFIAAMESGDFHIQLIPNMWKSRFGDGIKQRAIVAFIGGIIAMFGARLADGCPSGHGLSGSLQLSVSSYIALICFFIGGLISANWLYRGGK